MKEGKTLIKYKDNNNTKEIKQIIKKRSYELALIIDPNTTKKEKDELLEKYINLISEEGEVVSKNIWGDRELVYPIKKINTAYYVVINFITYPDKVEKLLSLLKNEEKLLRFLVVRTNPKED